MTPKIINIFCKNFGVQNLLECKFFFSSTNIALRNNNNNRIYFNLTNFNSDIIFEFVNQIEKYIIQHFIKIA